MGISATKQNDKKVILWAALTICTVSLLPAKATAFLVPLQIKSTSNVLRHRMLERSNNRILPFIRRRTVLRDVEFIDDKLPLISDNINRFQTVPFDDPAIEMEKFNKKSLALELNVSPSKCNMNHKPKIVGHRGSVYRELENTIRTFQVASEQGCDAVEMDVFLLKCGTLVVFHGGGSDEDPGYLLDYCGVQGNILDFTADEVRKLPFNVNYEGFACPKHKLEQAYIPTLREVLEEAKKSGLTLKLELKGPGTADPVLNLVEEMDMIDQCHFSSFAMDRIARIRERRPERNPDGTYRYKTGALFKSNIPENFIEIALGAGASEVHLKYDTCTVERIKAIHENKMDSMAWFRGPVGMKEDVTDKYHDVGNEDETMYRTVMCTGVKSLCVNKPDTLLNILDNIGSTFEVNTNKMYNSTDLMIGLMA